MEHPVVLFGLIMSSAAILSVLFRLLKQSSIIAFVLIGVAAGFFRMMIEIPQEITDVFIEIGIILLLFIAGLELNFRGLKKVWKEMLGYGKGHILISTAIGALLGLLLLGIKAPVVLLFFGLCLTFSSTIVIINHLKTSKIAESFHGQVIVGIMVVQDIAVVASLIFLKIITGKATIPVTLAVISLKMGILAGILFLSFKVVLKPLFRFLAREKELLFIGSLGWVLGIAALSAAIKFPPEIGSFMAGVTISSLPYKLEIQDKIEPIKDFGIILFFISLGYSLQIDSTVISLIPSILIISAIVLFGTPLSILPIGYLFRTKSRPTFYIGAIINQLSEFSLILATLCFQSKLFSERILLLISLSTLATIFLSSFGHCFLEDIFLLLQRPLSLLDRHHLAQIKRNDVLKHLQDHIIIIKYNDLAEKFIDYFISNGQTILLIDLDPAVYHDLSDRHERLFCMYADIFDPDVREEASFHKARAIISCFIEAQEAELSILRWLRSRKLSTPFITTTDSHREALELYEAGATFVMHIEHLASERLEMIIKEYGPDLRKISPIGKAHYEKIRCLPGSDHG